MMTHQHSIQIILIRMMVSEQPLKMHICLSRRTIFDSHYKRRPYLMTHFRCFHRLVSNENQKKRTGGNHQMICQRVTKGYRAKMQLNHYLMMIVTQSLISSKPIPIKNLRQAETISHHKLKNLIWPFSSNLSKRRTWRRVKTGLQLKMRSMPTTSQQRV